MTVTDDARRAMAPRPAHGEADAWPQALNRALRDAMAEDPRCVVFGEDVGAARRRLPGHRRAHRRVRRGPLLRHPARRVRHRRLGRRHGDERHAAGGRDAVRRVRLPGVRADRQPRRQDAQPHPRPASTLPMVIRVPYAGGIGGVEHHCDSSEAYYAHTPGLHVVAPATAADAYGLLREAIASPDPVVFLEPKKLYWAKERGRRSARARAGHRPAVVRRQGTDATLIAYGPSRAGRARGRRGRRAARAAASRWSTCARSCRSTTRRSAPPSRSHRPRRGGRRGAGLRQRRLRDRRPGHRALLPLAGARRSGGSPASTSRTRRRSWSTSSCPASTGSSTPSTTCSGRTHDQRYDHATAPTRPGDRADFLLPDLGEGLTEAEVVRWLVAEGDVVAVDQPVVEVETAKSMVEVPSPYAGRVVALHAAEGETVEVGRPLITVRPRAPSGSSRRPRLRT